MAGLKWDTVCLQDTLTPTLGKAERDFITHGEGAKCEPALCALVPPVNVGKEVKGAITKPADFECAHVQESELDAGAR